MSARRQGHVYLVGFMGAGKTTVGALLSRETGRPLIDLDDRVARLLGRPIATGLRPETEPEFRRLESRALEQLAAPPAVVATGGGAFDAADNRRRMFRTGVAVWLDVSLDEARRRTAAGTGRPLWRETDRIGFRAFFERRRATYALADLRVETTGKSPEKCAEEVFKGFQRFF